MMPSKENYPNSRTKKRILMLNLKNLLVFDGPKIPVKEFFGYEFLPLGGN